MLEDAGTLCSDRIDVTLGHKVLCCFYHMLF